MKTPITAIKPTIGIRRYIPGASFIANFSTSNPATGLALGQTCQYGIWTSSGKMSLFEMVSGNDACGKYIHSKAYCPAGKLLVSGGYILSKWTGGDGWNSPDLSMPSASENAWQIYTGGGVTGGTCMRAIAWCAKN
ncbi:hypothetical protein NZM84_005088 [Salmonella enterica]|nr:hypothetical protein [Salmonella enterica]